MRKISVVIILLAGFWAASFVWGLGGARADNETMANSENQVIKDEGYGNEDAEYYNSEDDRTNDEEPSVENNAAS